MELPAEFKTLYRHWSRHAGRAVPAAQAEDLFQDTQLFAGMSAFIKERMTIWEKKYNGEAAPYTHDPILKAYRFCNVFREFDRQTIEFHTLLNPLRDDFPLWLLNMFYCRMVARPETVREVGLLSFDTRENAELRERLEAYPRPRYGTPYVFPVSVIMKSATPTREEFIATYLPTVMKAVAEEIETWDSVSVIEGLKNVIPIFGFNLMFLWTEVLIDVAYQYPEKIDLYKEFPVGPGSLPTMMRINPAVAPQLLVEQLGNSQFDTGLAFEEKPLYLSAENWEGMGCEFRKYTNQSAGKGRKRIFAR